MNQMLDAIGENITIIPAKEKMKRLLKVVTYCRVSTKSDEQLHSLESRVEYYTKTIKENPEWTFAGVYAERASGADSKSRDEFNRMRKDAKAGKIDLILIKSIARFGRNTLPFLQSLRGLSQRNVMVYFEAEDIRTDNPPPPHEYYGLKSTPQTQTFLLATPRVTSTFFLFDTHSFHFFTCQNMFVLIRANVYNDKKIVEPAKRAVCGLGRGG